MAHTGRKKGTTGTPKTGGRSKGTPNKRSLELFKSLLAHDCIPAEQLSTLLLAPDLQPTEKLAAWEKLLPYLFPVRKPLDAEGYLSIDQAAGMLGAQAQRFRQVLDTVITDPVIIAQIMEGLRASKRSPGESPPTL